MCGNRYRFVIGRAVFWDINKTVPELWFTIDYLADLIYICDTIVHCHEGKFAKKKNLEPVYYIFA